MYAEVAALETSKRTLAADDVEGICAVYPPENDPKLCALDLPDDGCGCATADSAARGAAVALVTLALVTARGRRRARGGAA